MVLIYSSSNPNVQVTSSYYSSSSPKSVPSPSSGSSSSQSSGSSSSSGSPSAPLSLREQNILDISQRYPEQVTGQFKEAVVAVQAKVNQTSPTQFVSVLPFGGNTPPAAQPSGGGQSPPPGYTDISASYQVPGVWQGKPVFQQLYEQQGPAYEARQRIEAEVAKPEFEIMTRYAPTEFFPVLEKYGFRYAETPEGQNVLAQARERKFTERTTREMQGSAIADLTQAGLIMLGPDYSVNLTPLSKQLIKERGAEWLYGFEQNAVWGKSFDFIQKGDELLLFPEGTRAALKESGLKEPAFVESGGDTYLVAQRMGINSIRAYKFDPYSFSATKPASLKASDLFAGEGIPAENQGIAYFVDERGITANMKDTSLHLLTPGMISAAGKSSAKQPEIVFPEYKAFLDENMVKGIWEPIRPKEWFERTPKETLVSTIYNTNWTMDVVGVKNIVSAMKGFEAVFDVKPPGMPEAVGGWKASSVIEFGAQGPEFTGKSLLSLGVWGGYTFRAASGGFDKGQISDQERANVAGEMISTMPYLMWSPVVVSMTLGSLWESKLNTKIKTVSPDTGKEFAPGRSYQKAVGEAAYFDEFGNLQRDYSRGGQTIFTETIPKEIRDPMLGIVPNARYYSLQASYPLDKIAGAVRSSGIPAVIGTGGRTALTSAGLQLGFETLGRSAEIYARTPATPKFGLEKAIFEANRNLSSWYIKQRTYDVFSPNIPNVPIKHTEYKYTLKSPNRELLAPVYGAQFMTTVYVTMGLTALNQVVDVPRLGYSLGEGFKQSISSPESMGRVAAAGALGFVWGAGTEGWRQYGPDIKGGVKGIVGKANPFELYYQGMRFGSEKLFTGMEWASIRINVASMYGKMRAEGGPQVKTQLEQPAFWTSYATEKGANPFEYGWKGANRVKTALTPEPSWDAGIYRMASIRERYVPPKPVNPILLDYWKNPPKDMTKSFFEAYTPPAKPPIQNAPKQENMTAFNLTPELKREMIRESIQEDIYLREAGRTKSEQMAAIRDFQASGLKFGVGQRARMGEIALERERVEQKQLLLVNVRVGQMYWVGQRFRTPPDVPRIPRIVVPDIDIPRMAFLGGKTTKSSHKAKGRAGPSYAPSIAGIDMGRIAKSTKGLFSGGEIRGMPKISKKAMRMFM